jgi:preprotein translocase subunit SecD
MLDFPRWKTISISIILLLGILFSIPSFLSEKTRDSLPAFMQAKVNLGLDLAGGSHLLLEADIDDLRKTQLANMEKTVRAAMNGERGPDDDIAIGELTTEGGKISFLIRDQAQLDDARDRLFSQTQGAAMTGQRDWNIDIVDTTRIVMTPTTAGQTQAVADAMDSARDIIDKRVNDLGTREPTIIREGNDRVVVQVPGLQDPAALKELIGKTARLEFRMVDPNADPAEAAAGRVPVGSEIVPYAEGEGSGATFEVLRRQVMISGEQLINAKQSFDPQSNEPVVSISFDSGGSEHLCQGDRAECRQTLCDGAGRQGAVGAVDQRTDPGGKRADFGQLFGGKRQRAGDLAALGRLAGEDGGGRRTHGDPRTGRRFDPQGRDRGDHRHRRGAGADDGRLWPLRHLCEYRVVL